MRILPAAVTAIADFELRRRLRSRASLVGAIGFLLVLAAGHYLYWTAPPPRPEDSRLFGDAFALFIIAAAHLGISDDRMHGVDTFLVGNLVSPARYVAGKILGAFAFLVILTAGAAFVAAALSLGDIAYATWYPLQYALMAWMCVPLLLLVELVMETRNAGAVVLILFFTTLFTLVHFHGAVRVTTWFGLRTTPMEFGSLGPLAMRALGSSALLLLLYPVCRWRLGRAVPR